VHGTVAQVAWVSAVGGFAMLPDLDQRGATISRMWGPVTDVPAGVVGRISGGHRWGTHDVVLAPVAFGLLAYAASGAWWSSLLLLALAIGLALRALNFVIPGRAENTVIGNLLMSWSAAWLLLDHSPSPSWLPLAVMAGVGTHIVGDALTCQGVPVPLLWTLRRSRLAVTPMRTGATLEKAVLVPLFSAATLAFLYLNTGAREALDPLVQLLALGG
jgi:membrane-bound metal-dependent hydrolase YbcI (DUF457 family)